MKALSLKSDVLKPNWVNSFHLIIHIDNESYHCHDNEEVPPNSEISLKAQFPLPISPSVECLKCEEIISQEEFADGYRLCLKCAKKYKLQQLSRER